FVYALQVRTVKVSNVSLSASLHDIKEFFSFSGDIEHVEMQRFIIPITCNCFSPCCEVKVTGGAESAAQKAEDVVTSMLAKGFILGKDAIGKAKSFDEKHHLTSTASSKVSSFDKKIGLTEKISMGTSAVNEKVKEMDQKFQVSEKTKSAFAAAEQKVSVAGSAIMKNRYVFTGASWVTGAFNK
ncbi:hypothetical protein BHE74_00059758, partial [Ensete ventricosum]